MDSNLQQRIKCLLDRLKKEVPGNIFTGAGIIVYESLDNLPLFLIGPKPKVKGDVDLFNLILKSSLATNKNHDGFNMISKDFQLTHQNAYFSPPIDPSVDFDSNQGYGTRYVAALMGSVIKGVLMTAVVSNSYGIVIFKNGKVICENKND